MRWILLATVLGFLGGLITGESVLAQEKTEEDIYWASKPVQCGPIEQAIDLAEQQGFIPIFGATGLSNSVNYSDPLPVVITLYYDPETESWIIVEFDSQGKESCVIAQGQGTEFNRDNINSLLQSLVQQ